jgi:Co/Zn/Cd efflux system component
LARRSLAGKVMAVVILAPASLAGWEAVHRLTDPRIPEVTPLVITSLGAIAINGTSAWLLARLRHGGGSLSTAAFLSARNDVLVNLAIITMGLVTWRTRSGWPDLILGCAIIALALHAAWEVWEASEEERLAAQALSGDEIG